jgi:peptide deformylase
MVLKIVQIPDPILNKKTEPVKEVTPEILQLIKDMVETCKKAKGIGLAAPQIGKSIRLCIINLEHAGLPAFALINPKIIKSSWRKVELEEGCLSIPGVFGMVKRPEKITVKALAIDGTQNVFDTDGLMARVIQHELDHLDGILFTSKMTEQTSGQPNEKM